MVKATRRLGLIFPIDWMRYAELSYLFAVPPIFTTLEEDNPVAEYVGELARIYNSIVLARVWEGCGKRGAEVDTAPLERAAKRLAEFLSELKTQGGAAKVAAEALTDVAVTYTDEVCKAIKIIAEIEDDEKLMQVAERIAQLRIFLSSLSEELS
jgi:hypothetical protein